MEKVELLRKLNRLNEIVAEANEIISEIWAKLVLNKLSSIYFSPMM